MFKRIIEQLYFHQHGNLAFYDTFTGLHNRNWWELCAKKNLQHQQLYISLLDLNELKIVNDTKGHQEGDKLILQLAQALLKSFPSDYICRLGGDEFLLISHFNPKNKLEKLKRSISFSYGTVLKSASQDLSVALHIADERMYRMKHI